MKRLMIIMAVLLVSVTVSAQHLEFMGISINGTITQFQAKLIAKGCKVSPDNKSLPAGERAFSGVLNGKNCEFLIHYDKKTKTVAYVEVSIKTKNSKNAEDNYNSFKSYLNNTFYNRFTVVKNEDFSYMIKVNRSSANANTEEKSYLGDINLDLEQTISEPKYYITIIKFYDSANCYDFMINELLY